MHYHYLGPNRSQACSVSSHAFWNFLFLLGNSTKPHVVVRCLTLITLTSFESLKPEEEFGEATKKDIYCSKV